MIIQEEGHSAEASTWIDAQPEAVWGSVANIESLGKRRPILHTMTSSNGGRGPADAAA